MPAHKSYMYSEMWLTRQAEDWKTTQAYLKGKFSSGTEF